MCITGSLFCTAEIGGTLKINYMLIKKIKKIKEQKVISRTEKKKKKENLLLRSQVSSFLNCSRSQQEEAISYSHC